MRMRGPPRRCELSFLSLPQSTKWLLRDALALAYHSCRAARPHPPPSSPLTGPTLAFLVLARSMEEQGRQVCLSSLPSQWTLEAYARNHSLAWHHFPLAIDRDIRGRQDGTASILLWLRHHREWHDARRHIQLCKCESQLRVCLTRKYR